MKCVDASAILRVVFAESGPAIDRARLLGHIDDATTATKRKELGDLLGMLDLAPIDEHVLARARSSFAVPLRSPDAIHIATAEVLAAAAEGEPIEFWTHDERQAIAATSRGFVVHGIERDERQAR